VQPSYSRWRPTPSGLLRAFDTSTVEGRSKERYRRAFLTTLASGFAKVVGIGTILISVPLTLHYLGVERYGLWMTISSLIACLNFLDLGINLGLLNGISESHGKEDRTLARQYVSSAFFFLTATALLAGLVFALVYRWIPWHSLFNVRSGPAVAEAGPAAAVLVACLLMSIPAGMVTRIQSGYQEGFAANLWAGAGSVMGLLAILVVIHRRGSLALLVLATAGAPLLALVLNGAVLFGYQRPWLRPAWRHVKRGVSKHLVRAGLLFFFLQLAVAISFSSDNIVVAQVLGPAAVTQYAIPAKLFGLIGVGCSLLVAPLWPAYTEALARGDVGWIRKTLRRSMSLSLAISVGVSLLLVVSAPSVLKIWVGSKVHASLLLLAALAVWSIVLALSVPVAMLLNAATVVKFQVKVASLGALVNIGLSIYFTQQIGIPGVILGSICAHVTCVLIPYCFFTPGFLRSLTRIPAA
jgi:O-antigen/teichoic acid export membrane protein